MKFLYYICFLCLIFVYGCDNNNEQGNDNSVACGSGQSAYLGCWQTPNCVPPVDSSSSYPGYKYVINFSNDERIVQTVLSFDNSSCSGSPVNEFEAVSEAWDYKELGAETLPSGLAGYRLELFGIPEAQLLVAVTSNNQLCISDNFYFLGGFYRVDYPPGITDVDYNNCFDFVSR